VHTVTAHLGGARASGTASPITVVGLTNGAGYWFAVTAANAAGTGQSSYATGNRRSAGRRGIGPGAAERHPEADVPAFDPRPDLGSPPATDGQHAPPGDATTPVGVVLAAGDVPADLAAPEVALAAAEA
jgi:hypothetical protein